MRVIVLPSAALLHCILRLKLDNLRQVADAVGMARSAPTEVTSAAATVRASVVSLIADGLASRNLAFDPLLVGGVAEPSQLADPYAELDLRQYVAIFEGAAVLTRDPFFGLRLAQDIDLEQFGPLGIVILAAGTLGKATRAWARYSATWQSGTTTEVVAHGDVTECIYQIDDATIMPRRQDTEFTLALVCRLFHVAVGGPWTPLGVQFEHAAPAGFDTAAAKRLYQRAFRSPVEFGASSNRILIDSGDLDLPTSGAYQRLAPHVEHLLQTLERPHRIPQRLTERATRLIRNRLGYQPVTVQSIAAALGISTRTLQRRLEEEGVSVRSILRDCRRSRAEAMLADPTRQVTTVAHSLGYADTAVLSRAFKSWTGSAPRTYRRGKPTPGQ
jgi:AraC-like DNA-binding protein